MSYSSASDMIASIPLVRPCLLTSYSSFSPHINAMRQVRFSISILWAWNVETERSRGVSLTNSKFGEHTGFLCLFKENITLCRSSCINVVGPGASSGCCALSPPTAQPCVCTCEVQLPRGQSGIPKPWLGGSRVFSSLAFGSKTFQGVKAAFKQLPVAPTGHSE